MWKKFHFIEYDFFVSNIHFSPNPQVFLTFKLRNERSVASGAIPHHLTGGMRGLGRAESPWAVSRDRRGQKKIKHVDGSVASDYDFVTQIILARYL